jgi:hypothetical protein
MEKNRQLYNEKDVVVMSNYMSRFCFLASYVAENLLLTSDITYRFIFWKSGGILLSQNIT